jgi:hypothetical protein
VLGEAADPLEGIADIRVARPMPTAEQGTQEERRVFEDVHPSADEPFDSTPTTDRQCGRRIILP